MKYDYKKTIIKGLVITALGGISSLIVYLSGLELDPVASAVVILLTALLKSAENYLKNKDNIY